METTEPIIQTHTQKCKHCDCIEDRDSFYVCKDCDYEFCGKCREKSKYKIKRCPVCNSKNIPNVRKFGVLSSFGFKDFADFSEKEKDDFFKSRHEFRQINDLGIGQKPEKRMPKPLSKKHSILLKKR